MWLAGMLSLVVHTCGVRFSNEFLARPAPTLAMGAVMGIIWGFPLTVLALRRDLETATGFHRMQDFALLGRLLRGPMLKFCYTLTTYD